MRHHLSIIGDIDTISSVIPKMEGIEVHKGANEITFTSVSQDEMTRFKRSLALNLSDLIINNYEKVFFNKIINSNYCYFNPIERKSILDKAVITASEPPLDYKKGLIESKLRDFLSSSDNLVLDGFLNFRLKEYQKHLEDAVDKAVDKFLTEKEYLEFISLLQYFVEIQEPKEYLVHVVASSSGSYCLYNNKLTEITRQCLDDFLDAIDDFDINFDDLLISSLITLAPLSIVFHNSELVKNKEVLETLSKVFTGKLTYCNSCPLCSDKKGF